MFVAVGKGVVVVAGHDGARMHQPEAVRAGLLAAGCWSCPVAWSAVLVRATVAGCCAVDRVATELVAAVV